MNLTKIADMFDMNRILIVTSRVTFVPKNYANLFLEFIEQRKGNQYFKDNFKVKVVFLDNRSPSLTFKALMLMTIGAYRIGFHLMRNLLQSYGTDPRLKILNNAGIEYYFFRSPNTLEFRNFLRQEKIDLLINARTRFIYKKKTLNSPKLGSFNIHHGILPENRGTMCDLWAMYKDQELGFSIHQMNEKIDDGRIIDVFKHTDPTIKQHKNYAAYLENSSKIEGQKLFEFIRDKYEEIEKHGLQNISKSNNKVSSTPHSKNPTFIEIWKMKLKGLKL